MRSDPVEIMRAFDNLPPLLRAAIAFADRVYDPGEMASRISKGRRTETILRGIAAYEQKVPQ